MYHINVNGTMYECEEDKKLLRFLRDDLRLTAAKDGCSEGVCGACTVLADGKKTKACVVPLSRLEGKEILTAEGIDPAEMAVYEYCFGAAGAVQCGFCIPGMIISAKSLLDGNLNPAREDVKKAIRGNLCRCTGYKKIEDAILMAAEFFRKRKEIPAPFEKLRLRSDSARIDAAEKVNGSGVFTDDIFVEGMVHAKMLCSKYPRARINRIDISRALAHPDCLHILTKKDVPHNKTGHIKQDWDVMMGEGDITRYVGNVLAVAASEKEDKLTEICSLIDVDYTELPAVTSPEDALREDAPLVHEDGNIMSRANLIRGDADTALKNSKYTVTRKYKTSWQEHGFMEPECCVAMPEGEDGLLIYTGSQSVYDVRRECSHIMGLPPEKIHCRAALVGGGFGGKEDMSVQPYAALMAYALKRPVKVKFTRQESLDYHVKRHPMTMEFTMGCDENGIFTGMKGTILSDTGAYASLGAPILHRACTHAAGPYNYQNVDIEGIACYTNNVVSGAFRGFGVTQSCFATEMNINLLAEMSGIDPWEIRRRNAVKPGDVLPNGQIVSSDTNLAACLDAVKDAYDSSPYAGIACGFKNSGAGMGVEDVGRLTLSVEDGKIHIRTSAACMGQGIAQTMLTEICHVTGLSPALFHFEAADTVRTPNAGTSTASRQTVMTGEAAVRAAEQLRDALKKGRTLHDLEGQEFYGEFSARTDPLGAEKENPVSHISYSYGTQVIILDEKGKIKKAVSAFDVGVPINRLSVEGQVEGGTLMGIGFALTEQFLCEGGYPKSRFGTIGFIRSTDAPPQEVIICEPEKKDRIPYAMGAKGCGELTMVPTAPACAHAYYRLDGRFQQSLPLEDTFYRRPKKIKQDK